MSNYSSDRIHSRYADGTPAFQGQEPARLPGDSRPLPDPEASGAHSQLRWDRFNNRIYQAREFDENRYPVRDIDFTSPTAPNGTFYPGHLAPPHQHRWQVNDPNIGVQSGFRRSRVPESLD